MGTVSQRPAQSGVKNEPGEGTGRKGVFPGETALGGRGLEVGLPPRATEH